MSRKMIGKLPTMNIKFTWKQRENSIPSSLKKNFKLRGESISFLPAPFLLVRLPVITSNRLNFLRFLFCVSFSFLTTKILSLHVLLRITAPKSSQEYILVRRARKKTRSQRKTEGNIFACGRDVPDTRLPRADKGGKRIGRSAAPRHKAGLG